MGAVNFTNRLGERVANYRGAGLSDMIDAMESGRAPRCSLEFGIHAVDIMTGMLRSAETKQTVAMTTTCERPAPLSNEEALALLR